jgi:hypothetical protein
MLNDLKITNIGDYLLFEYSGKFSDENAIIAIDDIVEACTYHQCFKVLLDCRLMTGEINAAEKFQFIQHAKKTRDRLIKTAILGRDDQISPDRFFENIAQHLIINLKAFTDLNEAENWLRG